MQSAPAIVRHNARQLYFDIFAYGVLAGSAQAFLAVYAARVGAGAAQIGLLTAGPALVSLFLSLPAARWLEGRSLIRATFITSLWHRAGYGVLALMPALLAPAAQVWALPALVVLMSVPGTVLAIAFNAMFAEVVPPEWRSLVVGRRNALLALSMAGASLFSGWLLDTLRPFLNYQVVFGIGVVGAALSSWFLARIRPTTGEPRRVGRPLHDLARPGLFRFMDVVRLGPGLRFLTRSGGRALLRFDLLRGPFGLYLLVMLLFYTFQYVPVPVLPLFWVRDLNLDDGAISIGNALTHATTLLASMRLHSVTRRFGHQRVMAASAVLFGLYPLLHALAQDATLFWVASLVGGAVWGLASGTLVTRLMERVPDDDRPAHMALHNVALNVGILAGSLLGPVLGNYLGLRETLLASAGLRVLAGLLFFVWG